MRHVLVVTALTLSLSGCATWKVGQPQEFSCHGILAGNAVVWPQNDLATQIQSDARSAPGDGVVRSSSQVLLDDMATRSRSQILVDDVAAAFQRRQNGIGETPARALMLSGGGQWGAFGAGFLEQWQGEQPLEFDVVTGISTGAIQGLFAAMGEWAKLATVYEIESQNKIAQYEGMLGVARHGSMYDTSPLRQQIEKTLCPDASCAPLTRLGDGNGPVLFMGMTRLSDGNLIIVNISKMIASALQSESHTPRQIADCVSAVTMASASVPVQLRAVRIDDRPLKTDDSERTRDSLAASGVYSDGGIRASVFDGLVLNVSQLAVNSEGNPLLPEIYIIRNGPTVAVQDKQYKSQSGEIWRSQVDARPNALNVGMRAYSIIVNQVEVSSITQVRLSYPQGPVRVITADGYETVLDETCPRPDGQAHAFEPCFMKRLLAFGRAKAGKGENEAPHWIELREVSGSVAKARGSDAREGE